MFWYIKSNGVKPILQSLYGDFGLWFIFLSSDNNSIGRRYEIEWRWNVRAGCPPTSWYLCEKENAVGAVSLQLFRHNLLFPQCKHIQMLRRREKHARTIPLCFLRAVLFYSEGKWEKFHYFLEELSACLIWFSSCLLAAIQRKRRQNVCSHFRYIYVHCTMFPSHALEKSIYLFIDLMLRWRSIQFSVLFTFVSLSLFLRFSIRSFYPKR